jgi:hypothetical protein
VISHNKLNGAYFFFQRVDSRNGKRTLVSGTYEGFRSTSISLNNLNTEEKAVVVQLKFAFK